MSAVVTSPGPSAISSSGRQRRVWFGLIVAVIALALSFLGGYEYAKRDQNQATDPKAITYVREKVYWNDNLDFAFTVPKHWVSNFTVKDEPGSATFSFRQSGDKFIPVFRVLTCSLRDFSEQKGQTSDTSKCRGQFLRIAGQNVYTWQAVDKIDPTNALSGDLKDVGKVLEEAKQAMGTSFSYTGD